MFNFYNAARIQRERGEPVGIASDKPSVKAGLLTVLLACIGCTGLITAGAYMHTLWSLWQGNKQETQASSPPPYHLSSQHYFFKKQPLPEYIDSEERDEPPAETDDAQDEQSATEEDTFALPDDPDKAALRERVKKAMASMAQ